MSREGRGLVVSLFKNIINSLKPRRFRGDLIGRDYLGNEYFEIPSAEGSRKRSSRWYMPKNQNVSRFDEQLPAEWESWLRFRRREPPTQQEIEQNLALMKQKKENAAEIGAKFGSPPDELQSPVSISYPKYEDYEKFPGKKD